MAGVPRIADLQGTLAIDAQALGALRAQAKAAPDAALEKVAGQFEALFMQMMLKSMRDTVSQDGMFDNEATRTYMSMLDQQLATSLSGRSGIGLCRHTGEAIARGRWVGRDRWGNGATDGVTGAATARQPARQRGPRRGRRPARRRPRPRIRLRRFQVR